MQRKKLIPLQLGDRYAPFRVSASRNRACARSICLDGESHGANGDIAGTLPAPHAMILLSHVAVALGTIDPLLRGSSATETAATTQSYPHGAARDPVCVYRKQC